MGTLSAILVDDEKAGLQNLAWMLEEYCKDVQVVDTFANPLSALERLKGTCPDILFLDINMPKMNGFDLVAQLSTGRPQVVFTTAYEEYAVEAFKVSVTDYLLKPIDHQDLIRAVAKCRTRLQGESNLNKKLINELMHQMSPRGQSLIRVPSQKGFDFYSPEEIIYCQSESNYTCFHLASGGRKLIAKTLKEISGLLPSNRFFRIHQSYLVNLGQIRSFLREDGGYLVMSNGARLRIAKRNRAQLMDQLQFFCEV